MGVLAAYTGLILWRLFVRLDSPRHPLRTYGDMAERIFGKAARRVCTVLSSIQLLVLVATFSLGNGQVLSQMTSLCFVLCIVIWSVVGSFIGQIRTLKGYGWLANGAVWINLLFIFTSMGFVAQTPPDFLPWFLGDFPAPVKTELFSNSPLLSQVNGIMYLVSIYTGAMIFPEIMAEMRRPMDFWKGMALAQTLITSAYLLYGPFVYAFQGQFTTPFAFIPVNMVSWRILGRALFLITGILAAGLYGNIGIKILYINIIEDLLKGPRLLTPQGRIIWTGMVFAYWSLAFVVGSAIPQIQSIAVLIAAVAIIPFTYTFPPILRFGYDVITDAMAADAQYVPGQGARGRVDTWRQWSRWKRGLFGGRVYFKLFNLILFLGGSAMAFLSMWAAGVSINAVFAIDGAATVTSFTCVPPL